MSKAPKTLTVTEQHQLLDRLIRRDATHKTFRKGVRNYLIACLMLEAGLRVGEVVALQISHLFFGGKPVANLVLTESITKNHVERTVWVSTRLRAAMEEYWKEHPWLAGAGEECSVWHSATRHDTITTRQVERIICGAGNKALGRPVNPHMLRHTFGTKVNRVAGLRVTQELLGHSSITSTQIYIHPNEQDKKKAIDALNSDVNGLVE